MEVGDEDNLNIEKKIVHAQGTNVNASKGLAEPAPRTGIISSVHYSRASRLLQ